jgi:hypothetical protein
LEDLILIPKALVIDYEGLQRMRTFNSPDYSTAQRKDSNRLPDFRNVLYWQPDIETDVNGNQVISFYTSDKKGNFIGVIHGMTNDGRMGSKTFSITVKVTALAISESGLYDLSF